MRLIDADALIERHCESCRDEVREECKVDPFCSALIWVNESPTIDPVKHGKWEEFDCEYGGIPTKGYVCSECGRAEANKEPYCHCGARMDKD